MASINPHVWSKVRVWFSQLLLTGHEWVGKLWIQRNWNFMDMEMSGAFGDDY
jgi:hypothetical protein